MLTLLLGAVLPWLLLAAGVFLGYQLLRQNGRILLRLEGIEGQLSAATGGKSKAAPRREAGELPLGTPAPEFELPSLEGVSHKLSSYRGRELLLIFFNPRCGFCTKMAADLAALPIEANGERPMALVITTGDADENRQLVERYGIRCPVLLQKEMEVASQFHAQGTPMGYRIDREGRIASELAVGAEPLLRLAAPGAAQSNAGAAAAGRTRKGKKGDPSLARSRLNRDGLKAGAVAPHFQLPRIDGGELSLEELRGQRVLLVFSDPDCGPCEELAPRLQELHEERPDLQVVVISRRDAEANRAKAAELGLTYPIILQRNWEISLKYAMFATPVGYLIDEEGVLLRDVAVGVEPIRALADERIGDAVDLTAEQAPAWAI
jgi:peroxiredoxin